MRSGKPPAWLPRNGPKEGPGSGKPNDEDPGQGEDAFLGQMASLERTLEQVSLCGKTQGRFQDHLSLLKKKRQSLERERRESASENVVDRSSFWVPRYFWAVLFVVVALNYNKVRAVTLFTLDSLRTPTPPDPKVEAAKMKKEEEKKKKAEADERRKQKFRDQKMRREEKAKKSTEKKTQSRKDPL